MLTPTQDHLSKAFVFFLYILGLAALVNMDELRADPPSTIRNSVSVCDPYAPDQCVQPGYGWSYAAGSGGITDSNDVTLKSAAASGIRNYLTGLQAFNADTTVGTEIVVKDGSTAIWRGYVPAQASNTAGQAVNIVFGNPLRSSAATALNVAATTSGAQVYINAQGYTGQ